MRVENELQMLQGTVYTLASVLEGHLTDANDTDRLLQLQGAVDTLIRAMGIERW